MSDFESWVAAPDETFDLVTCAQAWHWIDRERGTRRAERLLRPGGWLAILGQQPAYQDTPVRHEIDAVYAELAPMESARSRAPSERVPPGSAFGAAVTREHRGHRDYTAAEVGRPTGDVVGPQDLPPDRRDRLLTAVAAAIERHGGTYRHHFVCEVWAAQRRQSG